MTIRIEALITYNSLSKWLVRQMQWPRKSERSARIKQPSSYHNIFNQTLEVSSTKISLSEPTIITNSVRSKILLSVELRKKKLDVIRYFVEATILLQFATKDVRRADRGNVHERIKIFFCVTSTRYCSRAQARTLMHLSLKFCEVLC